MTELAVARLGTIVRLGEALPVVFFFERSGLHLAGQLPAVDNCRSSSVGYRRQDELT